MTRLATWALLWVAACGGEEDVAVAKGPVAQVAELPTIPSGGGTTLRDAEVVLVSYAAEPATVAADLLRDADGSAWLSGLAEYGIRSVRVVDERVVTSAPPSGVSRDEVHALIDETRALLGRPRELVMVVYPRATIVFLGGKTGCRALSEYHAAIGGAPYSVVPTCGPAGPLSAAQSMEARVGRALANALTNPDPLDAPAYDLDDADSPWVALGRGVGDLCPYLYHEERGHLWPRLWSNAAAERDREPCVPAPGATPLFGVTIQPDVTRTPVLGQPVTWTLRAFDLGSGEPMELLVYPGAGTLNAKATLDRSTISRGETATLTMTIATGAPADTFVSHTVGVRRDGVVRYRPVAVYAR